MNFSSVLRHGFPYRHSRSRKIDVIKCEQLFGDKQMRLAQIKIGKQRHLQRAAGGLIIEIASVRRDEEPGAEKTGALFSKLPGYICRVGFDSFQINAVREKN